MFPKRKEYVEVISRSDCTGAITPLAVRLQDGRRYDVDQILDHRRSCYSTASGERGERWRVRIGRKITYIWREESAPPREGRWYVEVHTSYVPSSPFVEEPESNRDRTAAEAQRKALQSR